MHNISNADEEQLFARLHHDEQTEGEEEQEEWMKISRFVSSFLFQSNRKLMKVSKLCVGKNHNSRSLIGER